MAQWRSEVERSYPRSLPVDYADKVHAFRGEAARIRGDLVRRRRFDEIVHRLSSFKGVELTNRGRDVLLEAIDAIMKFVS
jgi:hypothetical protein